MREAVVVSCAPSLYALLAYPDTAARAARTLRRLGFPSEDDGLIALGAEDPAHLPTWWLHDLSLRRPPQPATNANANGATAAPAPTDAIGVGVCGSDSDGTVCVPPCSPAVLEVRAHHFENFAYGTILAKLCADHPQLGGQRSG